MDLGRCATFDTPYRVVIQPRLFGKLSLRKESSLPSSSNFLPVDPHIREHPTPPPMARPIYSRYKNVLRQYIDRNKSLIYNKDVDKEAAPAVLVTPRDPNQGGQFLGRKKCSAWSAHRFCRQAALRGDRRTHRYGVPRAV